MTILAGKHKGDLDAAGLCADRIIEAAPQPALASVAPLPDSNALMRRIEDLFRQVAAFSTELTHLSSNYRDPQYPWVLSFGFWRRSEARFRTGIPAPAP
jgi:hypothetical protein